MPVQTYDARGERGASYWNTKKFKKKFSRRQCVGIFPTKLKFGGHVVYRENFRVDIELILNEFACYSVSRIRSGVIEAWFELLIFEKN